MAIAIPINAPENVILAATLVVELAEAPEAVLVTLALLLPEVFPVRLLLEAVLVFVAPLAMDVELLPVCTSPPVIVTNIQLSDRSVPVAVAVVVELLAADVVMSKSVAVSKEAVSYIPAVREHTASVVPVILQSSSPSAS